MNVFTRIKTFKMGIIYLYCDNNLCCLQVIHHQQILWVSKIGFFIQEKKNLLLKSDVRIEKQPSIKKELAF